MDEESLKDSIAEELDFLVDRLQDVDLSVEMDDVIRDWLGHIEPSISRIRKMMESE